MRPRIGITTSTLPRNPEGTVQISSAAHLAYVNAVYQAGGLPCLLPNLPEIADAEDCLRPLDGLLLSGGGDIDPAYWHEPPHPAMGVIDPVRDRFEMALFRAAHRRDLPVFAICRGVQVMTVADGGDLWQDLPTQCPDALQHRQIEPRDQPSHTVTVVEASLPARLLHPVATADRPLVFPVNSFHHQAPRKCGTLCQPVAWSPDGMIEALTIPDATFILGVQWHPEEMVAAHPAQARLFAAFVRAAQAHH